jgi:hypothetical protein
VYRLPNDHTKLNRFSCYLTPFPFSSLAFGLLQNKADNMVKKRHQFPINVHFQRLVNYRRRLSAQLQD